MGLYRVLLSIVLLSTSFVEFFCRVSLSSSLSSSLSGLFVYRGLSRGRVFADSFVLLMFWLILCPGYCGTDDVITPGNPLYPFINILY